MFSNDRSQLRQLFYQAWQGRLDGRPLEPLEMQIADIVAQHPEYHALLADEAQRDRDYLPENGETNPFLHMAMHLALHEQLATGRPAGIVEVHARLARRLGDAHAAEHRMMDCLAEALWQSQRQGQPPDEQAYLACLQRLAADGS